MLRVSAAEFEEMVADALDGVPEAMVDMLDNVAFFVEDEPDDAAGADPGDVVSGPGGELLGRYEGVPLPQRDGYGAGGGWLPDRILLFRGPHLRHCADLDELRREIMITLVHEMAHHLGVDEDRLHELGWG